MPSCTCRWCCRRWRSATCCCCCFGARGPLGGWLHAHFGHRARLHHRRRGARDRGHDLPADGAGHPPLAGERRPRTRSRRRARSARGPSTASSPSPCRSCAGHPRRGGHRLRRGARGIRRRHHLRRPTSPASPARCRWRSTPPCSPRTGTRWRCASRSCPSRSGSAGCSRPSCWCAACAGCSAVRRRGRLMLRVSDRQAPAGTSSLEALFAAPDSGRDRALRPLRQRQDHAGQHHLGTAARRIGAKCASTTRCSPTRSPGSPCRSRPAHRLRVPGVAACSRI